MQQPSVAEEDSHSSGIEIGLVALGNAVNRAGGEYL
jgi:hypothetical protein